MPEREYFRQKIAQKTIWAIGNAFPEKINLPKPYFSHFRTTWKTPALFDRSTLEESFLWKKLQPPNDAI